jgi:hypothetical protein
VTTSSIPAAIDYLLQAATKAYGTTVQVMDGPPISGTESTAQDQLWIGYSPVSPDLPAVAGDQDFAALGARSRNETYAIVCCLVQWSGDPTMQSLRDSAFALLGTFELLLRGTGGNPGDCTLGGAVLFSQLAGGIEVVPTEDTTGAGLAIQFHVRCRARLTS